jgi:hypothetical protein
MNVDGAELLLHPTLARGFNGAMYNVRHAGKLYAITSGTTGLRLTEQA